MDSDKMLRDHRDSNPSLMYQSQGAKRLASTTFAVVNNRFCVFQKGLKRRVPMKVSSTTNVKLLSQREVQEARERSVEARQVASGRASAERTKRVSQTRNTSY